MEVIDKPALFELMLQDLKQAPQEYRPTNYWGIIEKRFIPELKQQGLRDFRRRRNSMFRTFGATDLYPIQVDFHYSVLFNNPLTRKLPFHDLMLRCLTSLAHVRPLSHTGLKYLRRALPIKTTDYYEVHPEDLQQISYDFVQSQGEKVGAKPISSLEASLAGNPEDVFKIDGRTYTMATLFYYLHYVYCSQFVNFENVKVYVELGSGMGKQVEVLKKLYPDMSFMLFDIPPQLYVCERYLETIFPGDVVSYEATRELQDPPKPEPGKIYMFGSWKFPILDRVKIDLFWNAASFQEMEPDVVANYLSYVNRQAQHVFLHEFMDGKERAKKKGHWGVLKPTVLEDYRRALSNFEMVNLAPTRKPAGQLMMHHSDSFWTRKQGRQVRAA
jgi:putative sugar O-methyltransferase